MQLWGRCEAPACWWSARPLLWSVGRLQMHLWPAGGMTAFHWKGNPRRNCMIKSRSLELPGEKRKEESVREKLTKNENCSKNCTSTRYFYWICHISYITVAAVMLPMWIIILDACPGGSDHFTVGKYYSPFTDCEAKLKLSNEYWRMFIFSYIFKWFEFRLVLKKCLGLHSQTNQIYYIICVVICVTLILKELWPSIRSL